MSQSDLPRHRYRPEIEALQVWAMAFAVLAAAILPVWAVWLLWGWSKRMF
jgi:hypothetical protein